MSIARSIPFGIFIALIIPSFICYIFIFIQTIRKDLLRKHIRSHVVLAVVVCSFLQVTTELPILLAYLHNGIVPFLFDGFCKFWACQDYSFNVMILMLTALTAIERYLLVFHRPFFHQHLILLHYLPMIFFCVYPIGLYIYFIFFYPCTNQFDYTMITCGGPCYYYEPAISTFDEFTNLVAPVAVSTFASIAILIRVIRQKHHMQQRHMWRKNRRLVIQLLYIVILHNIIWLPMVTCTSIMFFSTISQELLNELTIDILPIGIYVVILLCPFVSLFSLPELWPRFGQRIFPSIRNHDSLRHSYHLQMVLTRHTARADLEEH